jgi:ketopantoate reductase
MKSFAAAAMIGATSAEPSFVDFITEMAVQEAKASEYQAAQPKFAFQELLTQMHVDEIKAWEAEQAELVSNAEMNPLSLLTGIALNQLNNQESFDGMINNIIREEREKPSMVDAFTAMTIQRRADQA